MADIMKLAALLPEGVHWGDTLTPEVVRAVAEAAVQAEREGAVLRYTSDGELAECPCCGSLDVGGAHDTVNCYGCGLAIKKPRPLQNAADAWNRRAHPPQASATVPEGMAVVPVELTAENGAKAALMGEFDVKVGHRCGECADIGESDDCLECGGRGVIVEQVAVGWPVIKAIWSAGVAHFAASQPDAGKEGR